MYLWTHTDSLHRRLPNRMGCLPRRENSVRVWEDCYLEEHINLLKMKAVLLSLRHFQEVIQRQSLLIATDQYDSGGLSSESRGNSLLFSVSSMQRNCVAMRQSPDSVDSETCPRQSESNSGCIISILCSSEYGMRVTSSNLSSYHSDMGSPPIDLFATSLNYKLETFFSPTPDQKAWAVHAMTISW